MFQTTRRRLALWYTTVTAILLLFLATGVYLYVRSTLIERIDDTLKHVIEVVERSLVIQPVAVGESGRRMAAKVNIEASFRNNVTAVEDDRIELEWFSANGELLWSTFTDPPHLPIQLYPTGKTVRIAPSYLLRQVTQRIELKRQVLGYLRVSHPWFEVTKPIRQLILDLTLGLAIGIAAVAFIGWLLSGIAMQPIRESYQSLKQFTADASHELRNPIATIQTNVQVALAYPDADPKLQRRQLEAIERLTQRLGRLVNDLLFLARSDRGLVETEEQIVPLDALLIDAIEEQRLVAEQQGIFLSLHLVEPTEETAALGDDVFSVQGNWDRLARLFTNLIGNAIEYTIPAVESDAGAESSKPQEAAVEVELQRIQRTPSGRHGHRQSYLQIRVSDTGIGIEESALPHLFDRFYRVDPSRKRNSLIPETTGTGLGLAIAQAIVKQHRGQISVHSTPDRGTTFTVLFPAAKLDAANAV